MNNTNNKWYPVFRKNNLNKVINLKRKYNNHKKEFRSGGIIFNCTFDKVLLVLNRESVLTGTPKWGLPKGHMKKNEQPEVCAIREIYEETGLKLLINKNTPNIKINDTQYFIFVIDENIDIQQRDILEILDVQWIKLEDLMYFSCNRGLKKFNNIQGRVIKLAKKS